MRTLDEIRAERLRKMSDAVQEDYEAGYAGIDDRRCSTMNAGTLD